ncbi:MAG: hemolysin family protein [Anaerolineae bacterium]
MIDLAILVILALINGVFVITETAVVASRKARLAQRIDEGDARAEKALRLVAEPARLFSTVQIAITLIGQVSGAFAGARVAEDLARFLEDLQSPLTPIAVPLSFLVVVLITTYITLIIGELVPKALAMRSPERIASSMAPAMDTLSRSVSPIVRFLTASTNFVLRLLGVHPSTEPEVTEEEIVAMVQHGVNAGVFEDREGSMIEGVFRLADRRVNQLMTPRTEVIWLNLSDEPEHNQQKVANSRFSRFPVCDHDLDHVVGIVSAKDLLVRQFGGQPFDLRAAMREPLFVPDSMAASTLLDRFRETKRHSALVIGEYGGLEGMITIQDILEDIVGEIENPSVIRREDGSYLIDGMIPIDDFIEVIEVDDLPGMHEEYETLAGFILTQRGNIPKEGEVFTWQQFRFEIIDMDGNRVDKVLVTVGKSAPPHEE